MTEETKNLIVLILLGGFALASFLIWKRKRGGNGAGVSAGDIYVAGGTPTGGALSIPNPDGDAVSPDVSPSSLFDLIAQTQIG